jgi:hypothetical protein
LVLSHLTLGQAGGTFLFATRRFIQCVAPFSYHEANRFTSRLLRSDWGEDRDQADKSRTTSIHGEKPPSVVMLN